MNVIKVKAPAKINLTLEVIKRLKSGYHELRSIIIKSDKIFDDISIKINPAGRKITVRSSSKEVPSGKENICYQAAEAFLNHIGREAGIEIDICKKIPLGGGFGGGSTNGATVLMAMNKFFKNPLTMTELIKIADSIGKDVPVFLAKEKAVLVSGVGERLLPIKKFPKMTFLAVNPKIHSSTKGAFEMLSKELWFMHSAKRVDISTVMKKAIEKNDRKGIISALYNDFEIVLEKAYPVIKEIKMSLMAFGAQNALMSGAGSSVFGIFPSEKEALAAGRQIRKQYPDFFVTLF